MARDDLEEDHFFRPGSTHSKEQRTSVMCEMSCECHVMSGMSCECHVMSGMSCECHVMSGMSCECHPCHESVM